MIINQVLMKTGNSPKTMSEIEKRKEYWRVREIRKWQIYFVKKRGNFLKKDGLSDKIKEREDLP